MVNISEDIIIAKTCPPGSGYTYTFTHTSRLGQMLEMAEQQFGPRDKTFTILGWEFREGIPHIWFPGNMKNVIIQIDSKCMNNPNQLLFQMAHECVHLLSPVVEANVLEEGLATLFSKEYMTKMIGGTWFSGDPKYDNAESLAKRLLFIDKMAIRELRKRNPVISMASKDDILATCSALDKATAEKLSLKFSTWDGLWGP